jgi:ADP-heptose:LPS heptosyltransferase
MPQPNSPDQLRVVVPMVAGVGNALMALPMVRQIKLNKPRARVTVVALTDAMGEPFRRLGQVDQVLVSGPGVSGISRAVRMIRDQQPDVFLVPFPSNRWQYNMLALGSGANRVIMHGYPIGRFSTMTWASGAERVKAERGVHDVVQNLRLLRSLGIEPDETDRPRFVLNEQDRARATKRLHEIGLGKTDDFIAIHAGSARTVLARAKRWPAQNYAALIDALAAQTNLALVVLEGPDEAGVADEIISASSSSAAAPSPDTLGEGGGVAEARASRQALIPTLSRSTGRADKAIALRLTGPLGDAAAVLERANLYVGSDSGLAHLAAAVGTRAVTLFAPADPDRVCPFGNRDLVVQPPRECSPCFMYPWQATKPKMRCREPMCITFIDVEHVMQRVRQALG